MPSLLSPLIIGLCAVLSLPALVAKPDDVKSDGKDAAKNVSKAGKEEKGPPGKDKPEKGVKGKDDKGKGGKGKSDGTEPLDLPVPSGQPQKGMKIPIYDADGKLKMNFAIGIATKIDPENIKMHELHIQTYKDDGTMELDMDLPDATFNSKSKELTTKTKATIKRDDFEISGNSLTFNTETKHGIMGDGVRMLIYNLTDEGADEDGAKSNKGGKKTTIELQPAPAKENP